MKRIRCPIHNHILLDERAEELVDAPEFQRLRRVHQLGMTNLVYPGANHTRFEHSLGVYELARRVVEHTEMDRTNGELAGALPIAALLHDLGHGPFSHISERLIGPHEGLVLKMLRSGRIGEVLSEKGVDVDLIQRILSDEDPASEIVSSAIDVDKIDYLLRDAHYTGVSSSVDLGRLINIMIFDEGLKFRERGMSAIESLLVTRFLMFPMVYLHHATRCAEEMLLRAMEFGISESVMTVEQMTLMDDMELVIRLWDDGDVSAEIARRLFERRLYKVAFEERFDPALAALDDVVIRKIETEITSDAGLNAGDVIVDISRFPESNLDGIRMVTEEGERRLEELSSLSGYLASAERDYWRLYVFTDRQNSEAVEKASGGSFEAFKTG